MAQQLHQTAPDLYFIGILLLLSYFMSSAPRYVKNMRSQEEKTITVPEAPRKEWKKAVSIYTIQPYKKAFKSIHPRNYLAAIIPG